MGDPRPRPSFEQSCADALAELASNYLKSEGDAVRATVVVHVDVDRLTDQWGMIPTGIAALDDGPMIAGETALRLACDCNSELVIDGPDRMELRDELFSLFAHDATDPDSGPSPRAGPPPGS